jgi:ATP-dependent Clp protease ATP-binding subunit ClpC
MYNNFDMNVTNILKDAEEERVLLHHPYVGTEHLLLSILKNDEELSSYLEKYNLLYDNFKQELIEVVGTSSKNTPFVLYTPMLKKVINSALEDAKENNNGKVTASHLLLSILEEGEGVAIRILIGMNIDIDEIYEFLNKKNKIKNKKLDIFTIGTILNDTVNMEEKVIGRDEQIELIIETLLRKNKNNPLLLGDAGVGKTAIIEELTRRIERKEVPESLLNVKIVSLEMGSLLSGTKYRGEFEERLTKIISELASNNNLILFIDEIHAMVNAGGAEGAITAGDILKPALARGKIKCIGATTKEEYLKYFSGDKALMRRFEVIEVLEPNISETKDILLKIKKEYERHHQVIISNSIIDKIIYYSNKFINNKKNPDKSIDFLDSVCSKVKSCRNNKNRIKLFNALQKVKEKKNNSIKKGEYDNALKAYNEEAKIKKKISKEKTNNYIRVTEKDIIEVLENKTNIIFSKEKLKFLNTIEERINRKLFGIDDITNQIINIIKDNLMNKNCFLRFYLKGEAYLGKTTFVKTLAENYPKCNFISINLNEYKSSVDINKLIGTTKGYIGYNDSNIFDILKNNTFTIILFDNYNVAHDSVKALIKEILKEGVITDNKGEKIYFTNTLIFITDDIISNNKIGFNNSYNKYSNEIEKYVDLIQFFPNLTIDKLNAYLDFKKISNKKKIIENSNYNVCNYEKLNKLIEEELLIKAT